jgi:hypothetical protein
MLKCSPWMLSPTIPQGAFRHIQDLVGHYSKEADNRNHMYLDLLLARL